jgi:hypothetical protein
MTQSLKFERASKDGGISVGKEKVKPKAQDTSKKIHSEIKRHFDSNQVPYEYFIVQI